MTIERFIDRNLKLQHLRLLVTFAKMGKVSLVAEQLNVSQPAISKQISEIEVLLGAKIFERVGNRLIFTQKGKVLLARAREILSQLEQTKQELLQLNNGLAGHVRIGVPATLYHTIFFSFILELKKQAPDLAISIYPGAIDAVISALSIGEIDFALSRSIPAALGEGGFAFKKIQEDPIVICCGKNHPLAYKKNLKPAALDGYKWILPPEGSASYMGLNNWMYENNLSFPKGCVYSYFMMADKKLLLEHPFLTIMSSAYINSEENREDITPIKLKVNSFLESVWVIYNQSYAQPNIVRSISILKRIYENN